MIGKRGAGRVALAVAVSGLLFGCSADPAGVGDVQDVQIRFSLTGGIAGIGYSILIDGRSNSVLGESCHNGCSFEAGETLMGLSEAQIRDWADRLVDAGILSLDGTDFGSECCDQFDVELTYADGLGEASIRGSTDRMPPEIQAVINDLAGLVSQTLSIVVDSSRDPALLPAAPVLLLEASITGSTLSLDVEFGGGCAAHAFALVQGNVWMESFPVQTVAFLSHDDRGDVCDGLVRKTLRFRLGPLEDAYAQVYPGETPGERRLVIHIDVPGSSDGATVTHTF